jgi:acyl-CoA reductase-like NAD-dependent aldehyde dehydrogenase
MSATDNAATAASILRSAAQLFAQARNSVMRCVQLNTGQTLYELCGEIRDALLAYAARLMDRLPKPLAAKAESLPGDSYAVSETDGSALVDTLCLIINTSGAFRFRSCHAVRAC